MYKKGGYPENMELYTTKEVAKILKTNERTLLKLARKGEIGFKFGAQWRYEQKDINNYIKRQRNNK